MKKFMYFGIAAIALSMAACSSDDEVAQPENFGEAVKAQFTISFPTKTDTRMTSAVVQQAGTIESFRGMEKIALIPFDHAPMVSTDTRMGDNISLTSMIVPTTATVENSIPAATLQAVNNAVLYNNVEVKVGTAGFLFYGKAIDKAVGADIATGTTADADMHTYGYLTAPDLTGNPASFTFTPKQIYTAAPTSDVGTKLVQYLNNIAHTTGWFDTENQGYLDLFNSFTSMRAGASGDVKALVQDLYSEIYTNADALATAIKAQIVAEGFATATEGSDVLTFDESLDGFPADLNLPDGAAVLKFTANTDNGGSFSLVTGEIVAGDNPDNTGLNVAALTDYVYPAALWYRANSPINIAAESKKAEYEEAQDWTAVLGEYDEEKSAVKLNTKSIAIYDPIQYAVARLDMTVQAGAAKLADFKTPAENPSDDELVILASAGFPVTAVLVGGQKAVDFEFKPVTTADAAEYTIYDNTLTGVNALNGNPSATNYTLVLETAESAKVNVAIELTNNTGKDFFGIEGKRIPAGCKFYLVGELDPAKGIAPTNGSKLNQVFKQDYYTTVNFTIADLKKAYNVIPDLRAPKLELGLSVDLTWQEANTYNVTLQAE